LSGIKISELPPPPVKVVGPLDPHPLIDPLETSSAIVADLERRVNEFIASTNVAVTSDGGAEAPAPAAADEGAEAPAPASVEVRGADKHVIVMLEELITQQMLRLDSIAVADATTSSPGKSLAVWQRVRVEGLKSGAAYNGKEGVVVEKSGGRWAVDVATGGGGTTRLMIKPENLEVCGQREQEEARRASRKAQINALEAMSSDLKSRSRGHCER
jgi:hypothetical protein